MNSDKIKAALVQAALMERDPDYRNLNVPEPLLRLAEALEFDMVRFVEQVPWDTDVHRAVQELCCILCTTGNQVRKRWMLESITLYLLNTVKHKSTSAVEDVYAATDSALYGFLSRMLPEVSKADICYVVRDAVFTSIYIFEDMRKILLLCLNKYRRKERVVISDFVPDVQKGKVL